MPLYCITELLDKKMHTTAHFTCGVSALDNYLQEKAGQDRKKNIAAVYILRAKDSSNVIGYYTLSSYSIVLDTLPDKLIKKLPKYPAVPAILLGRLAIDKTMQEKGLGEHLLMDALKRAYEIRRKIGSFAVIVDAKSKENISFYERYGFIAFARKPLTLYLPLHTIEELISH